MTDHEPHPAEATIDLETRVTLNQIITDLAYRYEGVFSRESVQDCVEESYRLLWPTAAVKTYLPLITERLAKERLLAAAQADGRIVKATPEVLFICVQNAGRSQLAAALMQHRSGGRVHVRSAGSAPGGVINPVAVEALTEIGIDVTEAFPKPLTDDVVRAADVIVTMGCGDACPVYPGKRYLDWALTDPAGLPLEAVRPIRDDIDARVQALLAELLPDNRS